MTTKHRAAVQLGRLGGKARAARMSETELSDAGRKAASAPRVCVCGCAKAMHDANGCESLFCDAVPCPKFTPRPAR